MTTSPNGTQSAPAPSIDAAAQALVSQVDEKMSAYQSYLDTMFRLFPDSFRTFKSFMSHGNCICFPPLHRCEGTDAGQRCVCDQRGFPDYCKECPNRCHTVQVEDGIHVYDIDPSEPEWTDFYHHNFYRASRSDHFSDLQAKLARDLERSDKSVNAAAEDHHNCDRASWSDHPSDLQVKLARDPERSNESVKAAAEERDGIFLPTQPIRVIVISQLSPRLVRLLGGIYDVPVHFFSQHLPGAEPVSGRLIDKTGFPSILHLDFDELYESYHTLTDLFGHCDIRKGIVDLEISRAIMENFLFRVGWDYFPTKDKDLEESWLNSARNTLAEGFGISPFNIFQFTVPSRISIYSQPQNGRTGESTPSTLLLR